MSTDCGKYTAGAADARTLAGTVTVEVALLGHGGIGARRTVLPDATTPCTTAALPPPRRTAPTLKAEPQKVDALSSKVEETTVVVPGVAPRRAAPAMASSAVFVLESRDALMPVVIGAPVIWLAPSMVPTTEVTTFRRAAV